MNGSICWKMCCVTHLTVPHSRALPSHHKFLMVVFVTLLLPRALWLPLHTRPVRRANLQVASHITVPYSWSWHSYIMQVIGHESVSWCSHQFNMKSYQLYLMFL